MQPNFLILWRKYGWFGVPSIPKLSISLSFFSRLIRFTSPNLNYIIGVGAIIIYIDIYISVYPTTDPDTVAVLCNIIPWLTSIGYSLCYGTIIAKMWRVYYIINNSTPKKANVSTDTVYWHSLPIKLQWTLCCRRVLCFTLLVHSKP